jgi:hypothetical protein
MPRLMTMMTPKTKCRLERTQIGWGIGRRDEKIIPLTGSSVWV